MVRMSYKSVLTLEIDLLISSLWVLNIVTHESIGLQRSKGIHRHTGTENLHDRRFLEDGLGTKCSYRHYGYKSRRKRKGMHCPFEIILLLFNIFFF